MMAFFCSQKSWGVDCDYNFGQKAMTVASGDDMLKENKQYKHRARQGGGEPHTHARTLSLSLLMQYGKLVH